MKSAESGRIATSHAVSAGLDGEYHEITAFSIQDAIGGDQWAASITVEALPYLTSRQSVERNESDLRRDIYHSIGRSWHIQCLPIHFLNKDNHEVYPRVGGGTTGPILGIGGAVGLSPRGRGNPPAAAPFDWSKGSIPAWAGEPDQP